MVVCTTLPQRYGHMKGVLKYEKLDKINIVRFYTPEHGNSFLRQLISYLYFAINALSYAYINRKKYDYIFATSSRLGTGLLGYIISRITKKPLSLDIRDIFSDNVQSINFFKGFIGKIFVKVFRKIEKQIISNASWVNFVSPGFFKYSHIKNIGKNIHLFTNGIDEIFINNRDSILKTDYLKVKDRILNITYAGNIGFGQGLELIVLPLAIHYKNKICIKLIGDGSSVNLIKKGIENSRLDNIQVISPVDRSKLLEYYNNTDYHTNGAN